MLLRRIVVVAFIVLAIASLALRVWLGRDDRAPAMPEPADYRRIGSMAPDITEIRIPLGLGARVVGGVAKRGRGEDEARTLRSATARGGR